MITGFIENRCSLFQVDLLRLVPNLLPALLLLDAAVYWLFKNFQLSNLIIQEAEPEFDRLTCFSNLIFDIIITLCIGCSLLEMSDVRIFIVANSRNSHC